MGKVRDFEGRKAEYWFFDSGKDPKKSKEAHEEWIQYGVVWFSTETLHGVGILRWARVILGENEHVLVDVPPSWSEKKKKYVFNFGG